MLLPSKRILFQEKNYIVPVSASATMATQKSEGLKHELLNNPLIRHLFGDVSTDVFSKEQYVVKVAGHEVCIMPRGAQQQVRGMLWRHHRPDLILVDDLEDPEKMDSEEVRQKKIDWFFDDLMQCIDPYEVPPKWEVIVVGTILSPTSLIPRLMEDPNWKGIVLDICDDEFHSNIPEWLYDDDIKQKYQELKDAGKLDTFYREFRNQPNVGGKDAAFQLSYFHRYNEHESDVNMNGPDWESVVIIDPARTTNMKSAHSAIVGISYNLASRRIRIRDIVDEKLHPDELYEQAGQMCKRLGARVIGVEVTGLHEFITYPLRTHLIMKGIFADLIELHARGGQNDNAKVSRGKSLIPFYRMGLIEHNATIAEKIETPLLKFPKPPRWDVIDATSYVVELLESGERYMHPGESEEDAYSTSREEIEREFAILEEEEFDTPLDGFRVL